MDIYQHFRKEEQPFIDQVISWKEQVAQTYQQKNSDFLDPREQKIFASIIGNDSDFTWAFFGGGEKSERKRAVLAPYYETISDNDYELTLLESTYPVKFISLAHGDVLGAFLSMGVKRKKLGDLIVKDGVIQIVVASEIDTYVKMNLTNIKKATVSFEEKPLGNLTTNDEKWVSNHGTISSLRLDVVVKEIYSISRQVAVASIQKGLVKVNFRVVENPAFLLEQGDLLSLRGKGRAKLSEIHGLSKKDKWKVTFEKLK
ncbi:YlmH family RNA-binding protein [Aquibacillus rhizosphaerae]|uniref:RNA-binding protein n=1 Tax=Aquibacillus rhizosphaerae TaxID=3051431 RepID=A0ABT7L2D2_9BACI|nr:RNA-binding protein [Aquibacillus sp. LR5S19]MDL4839987.1 RNA-binding protein [Aquibacillus sp. LR5S19]